MPDSTIARMRPHSTTQCLGRRVRAWTLLTVACASTTGCSESAESACERAVDFARDYCGDDSVAAKSCKDRTEEPFTIMSVDANTSFYEPDFRAEDADCLEAALDAPPDVERQRLLCDRVRAADGRVWGNSDAGGGCRDKRVAHGSWDCPATPPLCSP